MKNGQQKSLLSFTKCNIVPLYKVVKLLDKIKHYKTFRNMYNNVPNEKNNNPYDMANLGMTPYTISNNVDMVHLCINCHANKKNIKTHLMLCINHLHTWLHCFQHTHSTSNFFLFLTLRCTWNPRTRASP